MDLSKTGKLIADLRREKGLTQKQLAENLGICSKTVSKWETGKGFPDISLVVDISKLFSIDISSLIDGEMPTERRAAGNVKRTKFYVCENCGNIIQEMGNSQIICCGRKLKPLKAQAENDTHNVNVEQIEDDWYITFSHPMEKEHYISFFAYVRFDRVLSIKLYPEQGSEVRVPVMRGGKLYYCCNKHGLFEVKLQKLITARGAV
ncbi:MAG: helix-turn-helix domain-containing protein [Clostridia bacterium]|nr:helix-turn-helix domain-containing protein [Clostridia bacterium]